MVNRSTKKTTRRVARKPRQEAAPVTEGLKPIREKMTGAEKLAWIASVVGESEVEVTTQSQMLDFVAEEANVDRKVAKAVIDVYKQTQGATPAMAKAYIAAYWDLAMSHIMPRGLGKFTEPGMFVLFGKKKKARIQEAIKPGTVMENKFTGESYKHEGRPRKTIPATMVCKARAQTKLKRAVLGE